MDAFVSAAQLVGGLFVFIALIVVRWGPAVLMFKRRRPEAGVVTLLLTAIAPPEAEFAFRGWGFDPSQAGQREVFVAAIVATVAWTIALRRAPVVPGEKPCSIN
jgi:hypothetical protein